MDLKVGMTDRNMGREEGRRRQTDADTNNRLERTVQGDRLAVFLSSRVTARYTGSQPQ